VLPEPVLPLPAVDPPLEDAAVVSTNDAIGRWYRYSWTSHLLTALPRTYAVRTAGGEAVKLRFVSYYCPGATPGCVTFEYAW